MSYGKHPSIELNNLYKKNPHQGASPESAKILFVGRDANWRIDIDKDLFFQQITEYLENGVSYWEKYGIHHPFLKSEYQGDGRRYHKIFSKLEIPRSYAKDISFVELLNFPTFGMSKKNDKLFKEYLLSSDNLSHLEEVDLLFNDDSKVIFVAWGLIDDFKYIYRHRRLKSFEKFSNLDKSKLNISTLNKIGNIYIHKHFSDSISNETLEKMRFVIQQTLIR